MSDAVSVDIDRRWRMLLWKFLFAGAIGIVIAEIVRFSFLCAQHTLEGSVGINLLCKVIIPVCIYSLSLGIAYYLMKKNKMSENAYDWMMALLVFVFMSVLAFEHYRGILLIYLPLVAIIETAVFANSNITLVIGIMSLGTVIINNVRLWYTFDWKSFDGFHFGGYAVMSVVVVVVSVAITILLNIHTQELLESISDSAVKQQNLIREMKKDPLTGLYNRRTFEESLDEAIVQSDATGEKAFVAIFDIDHFKNVNDTYGHSNGDLVIKALCKMLKEKSEKYGLSFRYGGEEFVILFRNVDLPKVINVVEDVRTEFRCYYFHFMNNSGITCSCGVAEYTKGESAKAWFNRADNSLYQAKEAGRNRTVVSE